MKQAAVVFISVFLSAQTVWAQTVTQKLAQAVKELEADPQMRYAIVSLYVADGQTGQQVYAHHEKLGVAPASTQKLFTSAAALEMLGKDYRYKTTLGYDGRIQKDSLEGYLFIRGYGDPTLGSWRYTSTKPEMVLNAFIQAMRNAGIKKTVNTFYVDENNFDPLTIPGGWIVDDIGNYYGAGSGALNWRENQYDLALESSATVGGPVVVSSVNKEKNFQQHFRNELRAAGKGSGDNAYIYFPFQGFQYLLKGTIPVNEKNFVISGAIADPPEYFFNDFKDALQEAHLLKISADAPLTIINNMPSPGTAIYTHYSPPLDSINYWFMRKSVNLYGEALLKTIALEKAGIGFTEKGVELVRDFWTRNGIDKAAIHIMDGSGLSPQNRVTTEAEVKVLQYARRRPWFNAFYNALPEYNGMKMKSGSIGGSRAFAGYHTARNGKSYVFSIIINNYDGSSGQAVAKMYKVLDVLK